MNWPTDKTKIQERFFDATDSCTEKLSQLINDSPEAFAGIFPLIEFVMERLQAVACLTQLHLLWDADIVLRSALETIMKYIFIVESEPADRSGLLTEFWHDLSEVYQIKLSDQAKKICGTFPQVKYTAWLIHRWSMMKKKKRYCAQSGQKPTGPGWSSGGLLPASSLF